MIIRYHKLPQGSLFHRLKGDMVTTTVFTKVSIDSAIDEDGNLVDILASEQVYKLKTKHKPLSNSRGK